MEVLNQLIEEVEERIKSNDSNEVVTLGVLLKLLQETEYWARINQAKTTIQWKISKRQ
jgi:hypothetical protein